MSEHDPRRSRIHCAGNARRRKNLGKLLDLREFLIYPKFTKARDHVHCRGRPLGLKSDGRGEQTANACRRRPVDVGSSAQD